MIRETTENDLAEILAVEGAAFGAEADVIRELVENLLKDPSAEPALSLLAYEDETAAGHVLFTHAEVGGIAAALLAPLAVRPEYRNRGVGGRLIEVGMAMLKTAGMPLVFVLGYPDYYNRHGFNAAGRQGLHAPFPILEKHAEAWMVRALQPGILENVTGTLKCANAINKVGYWVE